MDTAILKEIGLTDSEIKVYLALLKSGPVGTGILTKQTKLHKSRVYECLNRLIEKGLVGFAVRDFAKYFHATGPERLLDYLEEKKKQIDTEKVEVARIIPELMKETRFVEEDVEAVSFMGKEGIKTIHSDILKNAREVFYIGAKGEVITEIEYFFENYERERVRRKIAQKFLCQKELKEKLLKTRPLTEYKYLPAGFESKTVIYIYSDKVVNVVWSENPAAVMIRNKDVFKMYKLLFDTLWGLL